ncbi:amino acid adenylation domain-containing protein [Streptomyces sp. NPDC014894]|uniref:non-ribosomal peptide synthetase n=1 Tax=Streptomyces sp. NPDC014894 TaxID=3364931 RepID=UPI0037018F28
MPSPLESVVVDIWKSVAGQGDFPAVAEVPEHRESQGDLRARILEFTTALRSVLDVDIGPEEIAGQPGLGEVAARVEELRRPVAQDRTEDPPPPTRQDGTGDRVVPASYGQRGLWYTDQSVANSAIYNSPIVLRPRFPVDPALLEQALGRAVARHEALRTTFATADGELVQRISPEPRVDFSVERYRDDEEYAKILHRVMDTPFDLAGGPLVRVACAVDHRERVRLLCNVHHIVFDATSVGLFLDAWFTAYLRLRDGRPDDGRPAPAQYRDFVDWQRRHLDEHPLETLLPYWQEKLAGPLPLLDLPLDKPRPAVRTHEGGSHRFTLPAGLMDRVRRRSAAEGVTPYMLMLSAYAVLLHKYTRQPEVLIGSPASLRDTPALRDVVGYLVNTVVTRHRFDDRTELRELLRRTKDDVVSSLRHKHAPLDRIIRRIQPERSAGHPPVFQTMFVMPDGDAGLFDRLGLPMDAELYGSDNAKYDLSLLIEGGAGDGGATGILEYDASLFHPGTAEAMGRHFRTVLTQFADRPATPLGRVRLLDDAEEGRLLARCTRPRAAPVLRPVMDRFRDRAARDPDATALVHGDRSLTYRRLDERANQLARLLRARGVGAGSRVGVFLRRSPEMVVGLLGILKSGAAYVPIDPSYPQERTGYALRDAGVRLVVTESAVAGRLPAGPELLRLDESAAEIAQHPVTDPGPVKTPDDEFYVIYTSGSTGAPKGVVLTDATIANLIEYQLSVTAVGPGDRTLQYMSLSFDVSIQEILGTLCGGGTLVLIPDDLYRDLHRLAEFMGRERVARAYFPYIALQQLAALATSAGLRLDALREVVSTGEQLVVSPQIREFFREHRRARLWNMYGPSETHVISAHRLSENPAVWAEAASIGRPLPGFSMLVLDGAGNLVPPGVTGELHLGGALISPGYNRLPEETAKRFLAYGATASGARAPGADRALPLYRTGDLARIGANGDFEYLGRVDSQVKVRGYRIEPSEIESALNGLDGVEASAVAAVPLADGDKRLVAFIAADEDADTAALRARLGEVLPDYMLPSHFVRLDRIPTAPSGKIDRKALPALFDPADRTASTPPRTPAEREIADRWGELLKTGGIGAHDDFFALGGHSILATRLVYRIRTDFGADIGLRELLARPTVAGMAATVEARLAAGNTAAGDGAPGDSAPGTRDARPDLRADIELPDTVTGPATPPDHAADSGRLTRESDDILLTGATGFLGAYLLRDLLEHTGARIHCLVRAADETAARRRLADTARRYRLGHDLDDPRIVPVPGDLAAPRLGMDDTAYDTLSARVGAVYHAAAHINFVAPYALVKAANVDGMTAVLELCASTGRPVPLHYASTIAVFSPAGHAGAITERSVPEDDSRLGIGYTQSKWVAERLAGLARDRGLPVTVYRIGRIAGDSATGACQADDFFWRQIKSFVQLGSAPPPETMRTDLLPVDFVSRALVTLSRRTDRPDETFHLFHPRPVSFDVVHTAIRESGRPLDIVPPDAWFRRLEETAEADGDNALAATAPLFREGALELGENTYANDATTRALRAAGMEYPPIDAAAVARMIGFFRETGELD